MKHAVLTLLVLATASVQARIPEPTTAPDVARGSLQLDLVSNDGVNYKHSTRMPLIRREARIVAEYEGQERTACEQFAAGRAPDSNSQCATRIKAVRKITLSAVDTIGFGATQHGGRISQETFRQVAGQNVAFVQTSSLPVYRLNGELVYAISARGLLAHGQSFLNKGIMWSASSSSVTHKRGRPLYDSLIIVNGKILKRDALETAKWLEQTDITFVSSTENSTIHRDSENEPYRNVFCDDQEYFNGLPWAPQGQFNSICGATADAIAFTRHGLANTIFAAPLVNGVVRAAVRPGGVFAQNMVVVRGVNSTSASAAKLGGMVARIAVQMTDATGYRPRPQALKAEVMRRCTPTVVEFEGAGRGNACVLEDF